MAIMSESRVLDIITVSLLLFPLVYGIIKLDPDGKDGPQKLSFKTPNLSDEETHSRFIPETMKCDACKAVAFQMHKAFGAFNVKNKHFNNDLPESEVINLVESTCNPSLYDQYGLKEVDGMNRLTGEGLEAADVPAMISGGGKWPGRVAEICGSLVGELGEDEIYSTYKDGGKLLKPLETALCYGKDSLGLCVEGKTRKVKGQKKSKKSSSGKGSAGKSRTEL